MYLCDTESDQEFLCMHVLGITLVFLLVSGLDALKRNQLSEDYSTLDI